MSSINNRNKKYWIRYNPGADRLETAITDGGKRPQGRGWVQVDIDKCCNIPDGIDGGLPFHAEFEITNFNDCVTDPGTGGNSSWDVNFLDPLTGELLDVDVEVVTDNIGGEFVKDSLPQLGWNYEIEADVPLETVEENPVVIDVVFPDGRRYRLRIQFINKFTQCE